MLRVFPVAICLVLALPPATATTTAIATATPDVSIREVVAPEPILAPLAVNQLVAKLNVIPGTNLDALTQEIRHHVASLQQTNASRSEIACGIARKVFPVDGAPNPVAGGTGTGTTTMTTRCEILDPQSQGYVAQTQVHWSSTCWQTPACILLPATINAVADAMSIITTAQTTFSVRGRGHDFNVNHSSVGREGILLDMSRITDISLSPDKTFVKVGAGLSWGDVYRFLSGTGVSVNGARSPSPGIVGQTLGGGLGWFTGMVGVTAASVVAAEVVLANSSVVAATPEDADNARHSDLLWALKGGGPNYGVVTSFTYQTLPVDKVWSAAWGFSPDKNEELLDALMEYYSLADGDDKASVVFVLAPPPATTDSGPAGATAPTPSLSMVGVVYAEDGLPRDAYPAVFAPFYNITSAVVLFGPVVGTIAEVAGRLDSLQYPAAAGQKPTRNYALTTPHTVDRATYHDSYAAWAELAKQATSVGWTTTFESQLMPRKAVRLSSSSATAFGTGLRGVAQDWARLSMSWYDAADDEKAKDLLREMGNAIERVALTRGTYQEFRFMNDAYDGQAGQDVLEAGSYGAGGRERMRDVSCAYDPGRVFQRLQNGGWLLDGTGQEGCGKD